MSRVEIIGDATLYLGDCREILPTLGKVDAVVTDPPYGIGFQHSGAGGSSLQGGRTANKLTRPIVGDNQPFDPSFLLHLPCVLFGANHFHLQLPHGGSFHVWDKHCGRAGSDSFSDAEFIWCSIAGKTQVYRQLWKGLLRDRESHSGPRLHPSQKPVSLMMWCIGNLVSEGTLIIDPFMGSGTTGIAALKLGRQFIGIEIELKYFDIACRRISETARQPDMFVEQLSPPLQLDLGVADG